MVSHRDRLVRDSPTVLVPRRLVLPCAAVAVAVGAAGCGDDGGSAEQFCAELRARADEMIAPQLATQADIEAYLDLHDDLGDQVPLAIEEEWGVYVDALRATAAVVPGDAVSIEEARRTVYAAEESSFRLFDWVNVNCGLDLSSVGPVARYDPTGTSTTVATTTG